MVQPVLISIAGTQRFEDEAPETIELVTEGSYCYEPGYISISYVETQMTGLEGVITTFLIEDGNKVTLTRTGKVHSKMVFQKNVRNESLYEIEEGTLMLGVQATEITVLLNENGGIFDLEYKIDIGKIACGTNGYHIIVRLKS